VVAAALYTVLGALLACNHEKQHFHLFHSQHSMVVAERSWIAGSTHGY
jgi:hypothetical protein